jgi:hypothetical protein
MLHGNSLCIVALELRQVRAAEYDMKNANGPVTPVSELLGTQGSDAISTEATSDNLNLVEVDSAMKLANEMIDRSGTAGSSVFGMQGSYTTSTETMNADLNVTETAVPSPPPMPPFPMTQLLNQATEAPLSSTAGTEVPMDASGFNWEEFGFGPQSFDPSLFYFDGSLPNMFTDLGSFGTADGRNFQQQSTSNCIDNTFLDMMSTRGPGSAYQLANHTVALDEIATFLPGSGPISASGNTSQRNPLVIPGAQGTPCQPCENLMVSTAPALAPELPQECQDPTTTGEQAGSTTSANDMAQLIGNRPFTTEPFTDAAGTLNMNPHPGEIELDTNKDGVRKAKKPRKKAPATSTTKSDTSNLGKVVQAGVGGEQIAPKMSASGRPSRNRKRKEPVGAEYEREVERLESKKKKV